jgi:hypothetical protein
MFRIAPRRRALSPLVLGLALLAGPLRCSAQAPADDSLAALVAKQKLYPDDVSVKQRIEAAVGHALPTAISADVLAELPVDIAAAKVAILATPRPYLVTEAIEPEHGWRFGKVCYLYQNDNAETGMLRLFCAVHYTRPSDAALAARVSRLLVVASRVLAERLKQPAANGDSPFDVWLCPKGQTGGEQYKSNLYFYDLDTPRSSIEWLREIVHEYAHLALPAIGGYTAPEYWANGYLGERLMVRWLYRDLRSRALVEEVWGDFSGGANYLRLIADPARAQYRRIGPNKRWLARRDEEGMRYFIGLILSADDKYGSAVVGETLAELPTYRYATPEDVVESLGEAVARLPESARMSNRSQPRKVAP